MEALDESGIPDDECWELLKGASLGRLALSVDALPAVLPVQYYVDGHELAICLGHYRVDEKTIAGLVVAFAADQIDPVTRTGWVVNLQSTSRLRTQLCGAVDCGQRGASQVIDLAPATITGRDVQLCPFVIR